MNERVSWPSLAPAAFQNMLQLEKTVKAAGDPVVLHLVKVRASQLNGCAYCLDMHVREALADGEDQRRLFAVTAWEESPFFDDRERAALALTDAVTRIGEHGVPGDVWGTAVEHWGDQGVVNLLLGIGIINLWNRMAVATHRQPPPLR